MSTAASCLIRIEDATLQEQFGQDRRSDEAKQRLRLRERQRKTVPSDRRTECR